MLHMTLTQESQFCIRSHFNLVKETKYFSTDWYQCMKYLCKYKFISFYVY